MKYRIYKIAKACELFFKKSSPEFNKGEDYIIDKDLYRKAEHHLGNYFFTGSGHAKTQLYKHRVEKILETMEGQLAFYYYVKKLLNKDMEWNSKVLFRAKALMSHLNLDNIYFIMSENRDPVDYDSATEMRTLQTDDEADEKEQYFKSDDLAEEFGVGDQVELFKNRFKN